MDVPNQNDMMLFDHKLTQKLVIARQKIHASKYRTGLNDEDKSIIHSAKYLYRDFLEEMISGRRQLDLPKEYTHQHLCEMLILSDFDWTNETILNKYICWYSGGKY